MLYLLSAVDTGSTEVIKQLSSKRESRQTETSGGRSLRRRPTRAGALQPTGTTRDTHWLAPQTSRPPASAAESARPRCGVATSHMNQLVSNVSKRA